MNQDIANVLLTEEQIKTRIAELGAEITRDYAGAEVVVISLLKGAVYFMTDLTRAMELPLRIDFMIASSYGNSTTTCGNINVKRDIEEDIAGKHVILVDDIIDTGLTLQCISNMLRSRRPLSIKTAVLLDKKERRINEMEADYVGFRIPDEFVVGYGLDYASDYRNLPFIGVLKKSVYAKK